MYNQSENKYYYIYNISYLYYKFIQYKLIYYLKLIIFCKRFLIIIYYCNDIFILN